MVFVHGEKMWWTRFERKWVRFGNPFSNTVSFGYFNSKIPIDVIVECALERHFFFFGFAIRFIDYRQPSQTQTHLYTHTQTNKRRSSNVVACKQPNRTENLQGKKGSHRNEIFFFSNSLNKSCNDVNYYKFQCIMHTDPSRLTPKSAFEPTQRFFFPSSILYPNERPKRNDDFQASFHFFLPWLMNNDEYALKKWKPLQILLWYMYISRKWWAACFDQTYQMHVILLVNSPVYFFFFRSA